MDTRHPIQRYRPKINRVVILRHLRMTRNDRPEVQPEDAFSGLTANVCNSLGLTKEVLKNASVMISTHARTCQTAVKLLRRLRQNTGCQIDIGQIIETEFIDDDSCHELNSGSGRMTAENLIRLTDPTENPDFLPETTCLIIVTHKPVIQLATRHLIDCSVRELEPLDANVNLEGGEMLVINLEDGEENFKILSEGFLHYP